MYHELISAAVAAAVGFWMPQDRDVVPMRSLDAASMPAEFPDGSSVWDFSKFSEAGSQNIRYFVSGDSAVCEFFPDFRIDYVKTDSTLCIAGVETTDTHLVLDKAVDVFATEADLYAGAGSERLSRWMSEYAVAQGDMQQTAPRLGLLILPGADTIATVMMSLSSQMTYSPADALWNVTGDPISAPVCRREVRWYAFDSRYPVARAWITDRGTRLFICDPMEQPEVEAADIPRLPGMEKPLSEYVKDMLDTPGVTNDVLADAVIDVADNGGSISVGIAIKGSGTMSYVFTDMPGRVYAGRQGIAFSGDAPLQLSINRRGLPPGEYLLHLSAGDAVRNEKIILH